MMTGVDMNSFSFAGRETGREQNSIRRPATHSWTARRLARVAVAALLAGAAARCGSSPPPPGSFYAAPRPPDGAPGDLLRSEPMPGALPGSSAWKILYVSTGLDGRPIEVSGVVVAPDLPAPAEGRPIVAWAHPTTGVSDDCAPSNWPHFFETVPHLPALIALDYVVVATDYPGLGTPGPHPYLVGESEGRAVLDAVRAAGAVEKANANRRFAVWGHSQGGHAALFAGQLARTYTPELQLAGVAAIAPATELATLLRDDIAERAGRVLASYSLWSWSRVYGAPLEGIVPPASISVIDRVARDCVESDGETYRVAWDSRELGSKLLADDAYTTDPWAQLLDRNRPGRSRAGAPLYIAQGLDDVLVRPSVTADFVRDLCRRGEVVRFEELPGVGHLRAGGASASAAIQWMRDRFEGRTPPDTCPLR
jgi:acetyl esterase/lipase